MKSRTMKKGFFLAILFLIATEIYAQQCLKAGAFLPSMPDCNAGIYYLVFEDNFDGNSLDLTKWNPITGVPRDFNFTQQKAWHQPQNLEVSNGTLKIIAKKLATPYTGTWVTDWSTNPPTTQTSTFDYTTGELWTNQKFFQGKYEARCRLPNGKGFWPAFWTFGGMRWNEIDIFEIYGDVIDRYTCNVLHDYDGDGDSENCNFAQNNVADFTQWHTFTCLFDFDKITFQIDGNTVRVFHRFSTVTGIPISCGENIAIGTYYQEQSYPIESMSIILNLAIESGSNAPDANTVFPNTYEIDYVRFYVKSEQPPCEGCLDHIVYENTGQLPTLTRAGNYIQAGNNATVKPGQEVSFKAPTIELLPGFTTEPGATFEIVSEDCNFLNYEDVPINFIGSNNTLDKCVNPIHGIEATGVLYYWVEVTPWLFPDHFVYGTSGTPTSNHIDIWDVSNEINGTYKIELELMNCSSNIIETYLVSVSDGSCRISNPSSDTTSNQERTDNSDCEKTEITAFNKEILIYPNPVNEKLTIFYSANNSNPVFIIITDNNGKEFLKEEKQNHIGANKINIDIGQFPNGAYILRIISYSEIVEKKFIISR